MASNSPRPMKRKSKSVMVSLLVAVLYVICVLSISFLLATFGWRWAGDLLALNKAPVSASITVNAGESVSQVSTKLYNAGLIEYPFLFEAFAGFTHKAERISSGTYELNTNMDYSALLSNISASSRAREEVVVTIPEGYTVAEVFRLLEAQGACTVEELTRSATEDTFDYSFLNGLDLDRSNPNWLEGYLFPDTYHFYKSGDPKVALSKIIYNYSVKFNQEMKTRAERMGYTQNEIMIIASIIEKETDGRDQQDIASVIYNRLNPDNTETNGKLQMDSTVQYTLAERKEHLVQSDLAVDTPYNTYLHAGLPVAPICNPGMAAIDAALYPNSTDYFYFALGEDGLTHFFHSHSDFNNFLSGIQVVTEEQTTP